MIGRFNAQPVWLRILLVLVCIWGLILINEKRPRTNNEKIAAAEWVVSQNPDNHQVWDELAGHYEWKKRYDDALKAEHTAIKLFPYHVDYTMHLASIYASDKQYDAALSALDTLEKRRYNRMDYPNQVLNMKVNIYHRAKRYEEAVAYLSRQPNPEQFSELLGDTYAQMGNNALARKAYVRAQILGVGSPAITDKIAQLKDKGN